MSRFGEAWKKNRMAMGTRSARVGGYSFFITLVLLAILVAVNILSAVIPSKYTQYDISAARLYSVTSTTKVTAQKLDEDVNIYWIVQAGKEDDIVEKLLDVYDDLSDRIDVIKKDPDVYPTFAKKYTEETVKNNSIVVESGDNSRYIPYADLYEYDTSSYYSYYQSQSVATAFDGEALITAAIDYVVSEDFPKLYVLNGHGEAELGSTFTTSLERVNIVTEELSLLNVDEIPKDANGIIINSPTSDLSEEEVDMLKSYLEGDGKLMVLSGPQEEETFPNLKSILTDYGVEFAEGIVIDPNRENYAFSYPYILLPKINSTTITQELYDEGSYIITALAQGIDISNASSAVTSLLDTSDDAFSKVSGFDMESFEKEDGDIDGGFSVAVSMETSSGARLVWIGTDCLLDDTYNSYSSGANIDLAMNSVSWIVGDEESISIRSKSLEYNYLTMSDADAGKLKIIMICIIPAIYLLYGIVIVVSRRRAR